MTHEEAIATLESRISRAEYFGNGFVDNVDIDALRMALGALISNRKIKPINKKCYYLCPQCQKEGVFSLLCNNTSPAGVGVRYKACPICASLIDWSEG